MWDGVQIAISLAGSLAGVVSAVVAIRQWRANSRNGFARTSRVNRLFRYLTRPQSVLVSAMVLALVSALLLWQALTPSEDPPPAGTRVLMQLKTDEEKSCDPVTPAPGAIASLTCALQKGPIASVTMSLYRTVSALERSQRQRIGELGMTKGTCFSQTLVWEESDQGKLLCDYESQESDASLQWSRKDSKILVQARTRPSAKPGEVYLWWRQDLTGSPDNNRLSYPDAIENYLLEVADHDPEACERGTAFRGSLGAIKCEASVPDFLFIAYYGDETTLKQSIDPKKFSDGSCVNYEHVPAVKRYEIEGSEVGLRQCYEESSKRRLIVRWFNEDTRLFGFAEAEGEAGELQMLFRWWLNQGRFLTS